jgi:hypothetical protein
MRHKIADMGDVTARIKQLEVIQEQQLADIKTSFRAVGETLTPANLLKGALRTVVSTPGLRTTAIDSAISAGAGILGKKFVVRGSGNILRKLTGTAVQFILSNFVRNKMPEIKKKMTANVNGADH